MSRLAENPQLVEAAAKAYARQQIDAGAVSVFAIWKALGEETRRGYRDRAVEVLVAVDMEIERLGRKAS